MARKNSIISVTVSDTGTILFSVAGAGEFSIDRNALPAEIADRAVVHGVVQKVSDAAAFPKSANATPADKLAAMQSVADRLMDGEWSKRSGDGTGPVAGVIYRAFEEWAFEMALKAKKPLPSSEAVRAVYDAKTRAEQLALRNVPAIAAIIERIKSERGTRVEVNTDDLLGELGL